MKCSRRLLFAALIGLAVLLAPAVAQAATTYYVSPSGSDSNAGTSTSAPWQTISKVNATTLSAGQAVLFQGGSSFTGELDTRGSGVAGTPIVYGSYGTGKATIVPPAGSINLWIAAEHDVTIQNLIFDGLSARTCVASASTTTTTNIVFDGVEVKRCGNSSTYGLGIHQTSTSDGAWTIKNSYVHDTTDSGILLEGEASPDVVKDNTLTNLGTASGLNGYNAHAIYNKNPGSQILRNDISLFGTDAISQRFDNGLIEGNYVHDGLSTGTGNEGIGWYGYDPSTTNGVTTVRYNRFNNVHGEGMYVSGPSANPPSNTARPTETWRIYNNTFAGQTGYAIDFSSDWAGPELRIQNNAIVGGSGLFIGRIPTTYSEDHNDGPNLSGTGDKTAAANLGAAPSFTPNSGSPVIDAGTASVAGATYTAACDGAPLHYCGSAPDMGATESSSSPPPPPQAAPAVPTGLTATGGNAMVTLNWAANPAGDNVTRYDVWRTDQAAVWGCALGTGCEPGPTTFTNSANVVNGTTYCYQIEAVNSAGSSAKTAQACTTPHAPGVPSTPTGLVVTPQTGHVMKLTWTPNPSGDSVTQYNVWRTDQTAVWGCAVGPGCEAGSGPTTGWTNTALVTPGQTYCYQIDAQNTVGESPKTSPAACAVAIS